MLRNLRLTALLMLMLAFQSIPVNLILNVFHSFLKFSSLNLLLTVLVYLFDGGLCVDINFDLFGCRLDLIFKLSLLQCYLNPECTSLVLRYHKTLQKPVMCCLRPFQFNFFFSVLILILAKLLAKLHLLRPC